MKRYILIAMAALLGWAASADAAVMTKTVAYEHNGEHLEGYMAWDDAVKGPRPGILVVHEWWGLNDYARARARKLAALGYTAFALDMYGMGKATDHPEEAGKWSKMVTSNVDQWRARAMAGLAVLQKSELVDPDRIAAIGYCFGGSTVQQLAFAGAPVRGVVSFHGSPQVPGADLTGRIKPKILICHGAADPFTPAEKLSEFIAAMNASGADWTLIAYGGAKHSFTNPDADKRGMPPLAYSMSADERSWGHMKMFLGEIFK